MARSYQDIVEELAQVYQQRALVETEIITKLRAQGAAGLLPSRPTAKSAAAGGGVAPSKRQSNSAFDGPDAKRPKGDEKDFEKRQQEIWRKVAGLLKRMMGKSKANVFNAPVKPQDAPDYYKIILHPMDLGTINSRLKERKYADPREFLADMRLVWSNCRTYNPLGTPVRVLGDQYSNDWEKMWLEENIEALWDNLMLDKNPDALPVDRKMAISGQQLRDRVSAGSSEMKYEPHREMSSFERRKISLAVSNLSGEHLEAVLHVISESPTFNVDPGSEEEVEVDFDTLDSATMWRVFEYLDAVKNRQQAKAGPSKSAPSGNTGMEPTGNGRLGAGPAHSQSESGHESDQDVKGSNMVEQPHQNPGFIKNQRTALPVDESATGPKDKSALQTNTKTSKDVNMDLTKWADAAAVDDAEQQGQAEENGAGNDDDELWDSFKTIAEKDQAQKAEEEKRRREMEQERERAQLEAVAEARRQKEEEERRMREAEEAAAEEARREREEARQKELQELAKQANSAQVYHPPTDTFAQLNSDTGGLNAIGLMYKRDDEDEGGFDD